MSFIRTTIFPTIAGFATSIEPIRKLFFPLISQIGINYRDHALSQHTSDESGDVEAGDRLPYFLVNGQSIFDKLAEPKFHLLVFSNGEHNALCEQFVREFGDVAACQVVPLDARVREIFEKENDFVVFLRPDNHIAFISSEISLNGAREYLRLLKDKSHD